MPMEATVGNIYRYTGSLLGLHSGALLNTNVLTALGSATFATFVDDDARLDQNSDGISTVSINNGPVHTIDYIGAGSASLVTALGLTLFSRPVMAFIANGQIYLHFPNGLPPLSLLSISFNIDPGTPFDLPNPTPICLTAGTRVSVPGGTVLVETLRPGDLVLTRDHGAQPLRWIGLRQAGPGEQLATPALRPVRIRAGALGPGLPARDLLVSRQHRILVRFPQRLGHGREVLVPAQILTGQPGITAEPPRSSITYLHLLFDRHEIVLAEGTPVESLWLGPLALAALPPGQRAEIAALRLPAGPAAPARRIVTRRDLRDASMTRLRGAPALS